MGRLTHTVSGDIASFRTPLRVPIESLKLHFLPKQAAGTPTPENPIPIEGWTGLNGRRAGKNLIEPHYGIETEQRGLTITPTTNGISVSGTASARTAVYLSKTEKNTKLGVGDKVTFSLYLSGDISECENPFLGYYKSSGVWGGVIGSLSSSNDYKATWTVPNTYTDDSSIDSYIYVPQGVTVNFEIGLQMEEGTNATAYKPYFEEQIPITFPNGETIYGGYIDPVAGEIIAEWKSIDLGTRTYSLRSQNENRQVWEFYLSGIKTTMNGNSISCNAYCSEFSKTTSNGLWSVGKFAPAITGQSKVVIFVHPAGSFANGTECKEAMSGIQFVYELNTPIHIPIAPQDLKAFLDHNNFWSDANDITEVIYPVTESKDMLATRKKAIDFNIGHHKKVKWNNMAGEMSDRYWQRYNENAISVTYENGEAVVTISNIMSQRYTVSIYTKNDPYVYSDHYYYMSFMVNPDYDDAWFGAEYAKDVYLEFSSAPKNTWTRCSARSKAGGTGTGRIYIPYFRQNTYQVGDSARIKNVYYVDLTLMFGAGNEPTKEEFERICAINGIDLTTYQPYDTGSDRWLIIP